MIFSCFTEIEGKVGGLLGGPKGMLPPPPLKLLGGGGLAPPLPTPMKMFSEMGTRYFTRAMFSSHRNI